MKENIQCLYRKCFSFQFPDWEMGVQIKLSKSHMIRGIQFFKREAEYVEIQNGLW